jgi:hypothetical protein
MKVLFICILEFISVICNGQQLDNTSWTSVKVTRKDGSTIIPGLLALPPFFTVQFEGGKAWTTTGFNYYHNENYNVGHGLLKLGLYDIFTIDFFDDTLLVISNIGSSNQTDDVINRYYLMNDKYYLRYLEDENLLKVIDDTIIVVTDYIYPRYSGRGFFPEFSDYVLENKITGSAVGQIILSPLGEMKDIILNEKMELKPDDERKLVEFFSNSNGKWSIPYKSHRYFNIKFQFNSRNTSGSTYLIGFRISESKLKVEKENILRQINDAVDFYNKGMRQLTLKKYEKAIEYFDQSIRNDSTNLNAHYNKAYCFQQMGNLKAACEVWKQMEYWGQKKGEARVKEYCKE